MFVVLNLLGNYVSGVYWQYQWRPQGAPNILEGRQAISSSSSPGKVISHHDGISIFCLLFLKNNNLNDGWLQSWGSRGAAIVKKVAGGPWSPPRTRPGTLAASEAAVTPGNLTVDGIS